MKSTSYNLHICSLCAMIVLGNTITAPSFSKFGFLFILTLIISYFVLLTLSTYIVNFTSKSKKSLLFVTSFVCLAALCGLIITTYNFIKFLTDVPLVQNNPISLLLLFITVIVVFVSSGKSAIYKYCLLVFLICFLIIVMCFLLGIKHFNLNEINPWLENYRYNLWDCWGNICTTVILPFFIFTNTKTNKKPLYIGIAIGFALLFACSLQSTLTLGFAPNIDHPYIKAVGIISSGGLFTRLDGLVYFLVFTSSLINASICIKTIIVILNKLVNKRSC